MPISYGTTIKASPLAASSVGYAGYLKPEELPPERPWWYWLVNMGELAAEVAIGFATSGLGLLPALAIDTAVAVAGSAIITATDYAVTGTWNWNEFYVQSGIGAAGSLLGAGMRGRVNARQGRALRGSGDSFSKFVGQDVNFIRSYENIAKRFEPKVAIDVHDGPWTLERSLNYTNKLGQSGSLVSSQGESFEKLFEISRNTLNKYSRVGQVVTSETAEYIARLEEELKQKLGKYFSPAEIKSIIRDLSKVNSSKQALKVLNDHAVRKYGARGAKNIIGKFSRDLAETGMNTLVRKGGIVRSATKFSKSTINVGYKTLQYATSPHKLAKKIVDSTLNSSIEALAKKAKRLDKFLAKTAANKKRVLNAFKEAGGMPFPESEWIMGYRIVSEMPLAKFVEVSFQPWATNGKPPVYVKLSDVQFMEWLAAKSKGSWYIDNIATSRGGRTIQGNILGYSPTMLSFLPLGQTRKILGIIDLSEGIAMGEKSFLGDGNFFADFGKEVWSEFSGKYADFGYHLAGGGILGSAVKKTLQGQDIGKVIKASGTKIYKRTGVYKTYKNSGRIAGQRQIGQIKKITTKTIKVIK